ncbi:MAG TPA: hypothetical protein VNR36_02090 [Pseudolysinimonas sp.]|nr:hypothetical protein [Pseudolysinimonas sp.]
MYGALWRVLPGPWWVRVLILLAAAAVIVWACITWVFPFIDQYVAPTDSTVET